jgi:hypothetical protein
MLALDMDDIHSYGSDHMLGITKADWETSPVYAAQMAAQTNAENSREADLLFGDENKFGIYQIKDAPDLRDYRFSGNDELKRRGLQAEREHYDLVYTAPLAIRDIQTNLHKIYQDFNMDNRPADYTGHSVSVSDVIVLQWRGEVSAHYVDSVGFAELASFTGNERALPQDITREPQNLPAAPTVADLESDVKAGKSISVMDLARAVKEQDLKTKPGIFESIDNIKQRQSGAANSPYAEKVMFAGKAER